MKPDRRTVLLAAAVLPTAAAMGAPTQVKPATNYKDRIMYVCTNCADNYPEGCGHYSPDDLRVTPDGSWICDPCHDDARDGDFGLVATEEDGLPDWHGLPKPPHFVPSV
jgi:hypothetical protein